MVLNSRLPKYVTTYANGLLHLQIITIIRDKSSSHCADAATLTYNARMSVSLVTGACIMYMYYLCLCIGKLKHICVKPFAHVLCTGQNIH